VVAVDPIKLFVFSLVIYIPLRILAASLKLVDIIIA